MIWLAVSWAWVAVCIFWVGFECRARGRVEGFSAGWNAAVADVVRQCEAQGVFIHVQRGTQPSPDRRSN